MKRIFILYFALSVFVCPAVLHAQTAPAFSGNDYLKLEDYNRALSEFLKQYKETPNDVKLNYNIGLCYLKINADRSQAIPYLEFSYGKDAGGKDIQLLLGQAYMYAYKFDTAISYFNAYREKTSSKNFAMVDHLIENCESAKVLVKNPLPVTFQNLGKEINSTFPDYYPFVTQDETTLYFTTRREGSSRKTVSWQGYYTADIYFSKANAGKWTKAKNIGPIMNTVNDEECVSVSPDGKNMIIYMDNEFVSGDLFLSTAGKNKLFQKPVSFETPVNSDELELEGCLAENGNILIVATDRKGGMGETDLWMFKKNSGGWGAAISLGPTINTKYKEAYPYYDDKNNVLYFGSEGHTNMGGFDIFKAKFDTVTQTFGAAENVGYPINTPMDNLGISLAKNGRDAYVSAVRNEGFGDLDIYKVIFTGAENKATLIHGMITLGDGAKKDIDATVSILDSKTNELIQTTDANAKTGNFIFSVNPGTYLLKVSSSGYEDYSKEIVVATEPEYVFEIRNDVVLKSDGTNPVPQKGGKKPK